MSEKRYLLTHDEIRHLQDTALSALSWDYREDNEMVKYRQDEYRVMLEAHEYRERTCRDGGAGVFLCTACGAFAERVAVMDCCGVLPIRYCPNCGAKVVEA